MTRRTFSAIHPETAHDLAIFTDQHWSEISEFFKRSAFSLSTPKHIEDADRAIVINSHSELERIRLSRLSQYRYIAKTDISRFYHSIYTHSIPWAFHGKAQAKADRNPKSAGTFCNSVDFIFRCGQDGQTIGIPVGPDASRIFAEIISTAIDIEFQRRHESKGCTVLRHVDDVWIGANSHADAERALWRYREAIREFELDINESKTRIYSDDFRYSDGWPTEISAQFEFAISSSPQRAPERLRSAFEHAFSLAVKGGDDGVLKYAIRHLDQSDLQWKHWGAVEPFLKRAAVHFGHTLDYIARVIVWRHLSRGDLDKSAWASILGEIIDRHGRLGNDSEVCWTIFVCMRLEIKINTEIANHIIDNCGALSILSLLNCVDLGLVEQSVFVRAFERLTMENASGPYWPVILEWSVRGWPDHKRLNIENDLISDLIKNEVTLFNTKRLPAVFSDVDESKFGAIAEAIEHRVSVYDDYDAQKIEEPAF